MDLNVPAPPFATLSLAIDELVVHGQSRPRARRLAGAFERELGRLMAERGVPARLRRAGDVDRLELGDLDVRGIRPERLGRRLAVALWEELDR